MVETMIFTLQCTYVHLNISNIHVYTHTQPTRASVQDESIRPDPVRSAVFCNNWVGRRIAAYTAISIAIRRSIAFIIIVIIRTSCRVVIERMVHAVDGGGGTGIIVVIISASGIYNAFLRLLFFFSLCFILVVLHNLVFFRSSNLPVQVVRRTYPHVDHDHIQAGNCRHGGSQATKRYKQALQLTICTYKYVYKWMEGSPFHSFIALNGFGLQDKMVATNSSTITTIISASSNYLLDQRASRFSQLRPYHVDRRLSFGF